MEYCGGGDLMGLLIKKDILSEKDTRFYMSELAAAINYVHELGYVHRDLKPDNVLIANDGHIRLSDFGLAKSFQNNNDKQLENWQQFVATLKVQCALHSLTLLLGGHPHRVTGGTISN